MIRKIQRPGARMHILRATPRVTRMASVLPLAFTSAAAMAQQPADVLAPVVVSATREEARGFDTPASIDAVGADVIQQGQLGVNLSESLGRVPGLVVQNRQNYAQDLQISSRGFGSRATFGVRGVRLFADGIPATMPDGQGQVSHFALGSAKRVEVLRGPFSVLYGNSSGGVIQIFTEDGSKEPYVGGSVAFGSFGTRRLGLKASGVAGASDYVVETSRFDTDGYRDHSAARRDSANAKFRVNLGQGTTLAIIGNYVDLPEAQDPLGLSRAQFNADPRSVDPVALQFNTRKSVLQAQGGAVLEHRFDANNSARFMAYMGKRTVQQFLAITPQTQAAASHSGGVVDLARDYQGIDLRFTHRNRVAGGPFSVTAGVNYDVLDEARKGFNNYTGTVAAPTGLGVQGNLRRDEDNRVFNFDQYAQAEWQFVPRLTATIGVRNSTVRFRSQDKFIATGNADDSGAVRYSAVTPVFGLVWNATDAVNLYASYGRGFETPTFNELAYRPPGSAGAGLNFDLRPAKSENVEAGAKMLLGPGTQLNLAVFHTRTADEIVVLTNSGGRSTFQNAGHTTRDGVEAGFASRLTRTLTLAGALTTVRAKYDDSFTTCGPAPCTVPNVVIPAGSRVPGVPRDSAFVELAWRQPGLTTAIEGRALSKIFVNDQNSDAASGYFSTAWRLVLDQKLGRWTFSEFVRIENLFDRKFSGSVIVNEGNSRFFEAAPGRHWLVGVSARFQFQ